jgi:serine/threonine-protein kinase
MATVYLAQDLKHDRKVALKVLKPELAAVLGAERFVVEIKTTAALQHPHILPLFDSGESDGFLWYAMPFIDGETLRGKLDREGQLGVDEAVQIAKDVAEALDYAHQHGVIHRDIKPENILLANGRPMVADFGIALAVSAAAGGRMTETGLSLGTPHYMSPEQATAEKEITARSDIYSLGSVLYEMLTGEPPHMGNSAQAIIMKIVTEDAQPVTRLRRSVPPNVAAAVAKSVERLPADRFESAKAFAEALANPAFTTAQMAGAVGEGGAATQRWRHIAVALGSVAAVLLAVAAVGWLRTPAAPEGMVIEFSESIPFSPQAWDVDVSPDGQQIVLADRIGALWVRRLDGSGLRELGIADAYTPRFSPDGRSVVAQSNGAALRVIPLDGQPSRTLVTLETGLGTSLAWGDDGYVYFQLSRRGGLGRIPGTGGPIDTLSIDGVEGDRVTPQLVLPGGRGLIVSRLSPGSPSSLEVVDLRDGSTRALGTSQGPRTVGYSPAGYLLIARDRQLLAQPFDLERLEPSGEPIPVAEVQFGGIQFGYGGGTLVYAVGATGSAAKPMITDRTGRPRALPGFPDVSADRPEVSPDGRRIAVVVAEGASNTNDLWVYDLPVGPLTRVTRSRAVEYSTWTSDGEFLIFSNGGDVFRVRADGGTEPELVLDREALIGRVAYAANGNRLFFMEGSGIFNIGVVHLDQPGSDSLLLDETYREGHPALSPDGRWLAYYSDESGRVQIFIRPLYGLGRKRQVSRDGGVRPRWSHDGKRLFFSSVTNLLHEAVLEVGEDITVTRVTPLFRMGHSDFDVFPGDSLFATMVLPDAESVASSALTIRHDFEVVLRRLTPGRTP